MKKCLCICLSLLVASILHATEYHVAPAGEDTHSGTKSAPFRTIQHAAGLAKPGDIITVHAGTYRERIDPPRGGESDARRIIYQAAPGAKVAIKGSEIVKGWTKLEHDTWRVTLPNSFFGSFNPYADEIRGDWFKPKGRKHHTGAVYHNGHWLTEAAKAEEVLLPATENPLWFATVDAGSTTITAQLPGTDPNAEGIEINVRKAVFYPSQTGRDFISVRGFSLEHAATNWAPPTAEQVGLIGTHWSKGWIIENNTIRYSTCTGVTLGKHGDRFDNTSANSAEGYVETIKRGFDAGWSKESIGHHVVRDNHISHCEQAGIVGSLGAIFSTITGNDIHHIHVRELFDGAEQAAIKIHAAIDTLIQGNHIHHSSLGIWLDWMAQGTRVTGNLLHHNRRDFFSEVNHGPFLIDHNIMLSVTAIQDWSQGGAYAHNLITGKSEGRTETRQTPWFTPHTLENMRITDITKTDFRFHNNLFAGGAGTFPFDAWAAKLQAGGNVYLAGAKPCQGEAGAVVNPEFNANVKLTEEPTGEWWLEMAVDPAWLTAQVRPLVTTELLGSAVVPSQKFVQPDGTPYRIDRDYAGAARNANPAPGPFEFTSGHKIRRKVWPFPPTQ